MPKGKRHTPEQIVAILRRSDSGETVATVCRETYISAATFHRWKSQYGGMDLSSDFLFSRVCTYYFFPRQSDGSPFHQHMASPHVVRMRA